MLNYTPMGTMTVPRPTMQGQRVGGDPVPGNLCPSPPVVGIILPLISLWNYLPIKTNCPTFWGLLPSGMAHTLSVECVAPWINLLSLYYGSLLNSFLQEAENPHLAAVPGTRLRHDHPLTPHLLSPATFLHQASKVPKACITLLAHKEHGIQWGFFHFIIL